MDELEFCVKSLSYPLGMLIEGAVVKPGERARLDGKTLYLPEAPFAVKCYLTLRTLFEGLDPVDRKRLGDDMAYAEELIARILASPLGEKVKPFVERADGLIAPSKVSVDWLEFERRSEKVKPLLERILAGEEPSEVSALSVDECLLLSYLAGERKKRERVNAVLGKLNGKFRDAVKAYFKALRS